MNAFRRNEFICAFERSLYFRAERPRSPGRGERLSISKPRDPRLRVQRLVRRLLDASMPVSLFGPVDMDKVLSC